MKDKLTKCLHIIDTKSFEIPDTYVSYLMAAEDHRFQYHFGVDLVGAFRALYMLLIFNKLQGASTIEQQFVRVATGDYSISLLRKFREQILAVAISQQREKIDIAKAYLATARFGFNCYGTSGIAQTMQKNLDKANEDEIVSLIAKLKHPEPCQYSDAWHEKYCRRKSYIKRRHRIFTDK